MFAQMPSSSSPPSTFLIYFNVHHPPLYHSSLPSVSSHAYFGGSYCQVNVCLHQLMLVLLPSIINNSVFKGKLS